jgi:pentatricopeptide repeat protein
MALLSLRDYHDHLEKLLRQNATDRVISHCRHILQVYPRNGYTYQILAHAYLKSGQWEQAEDLFRRVLAIYPDDYGTHESLVRIYQETQQSDAALWHLERALELKPNDTNLMSTLRNMVREQRGVDLKKIPLTTSATARQYRYSGMYIKAVDTIQTALERHPDRTDLRLLLAQTYWENNFLIEAGETALQVLDTLPYCYEANRILAELWLIEERPSDATPYLANMEQVDPYDALELVRGEAVPDETFMLEELDFRRVAQQELVATGSELFGELDDVEGFEDEGDFDDIESDDFFAAEVPADWMDEVGEMAEVGEQETIAASRSAILGGRTAELTPDDEEEADEDPLAWMEGESGLTGLLEDETEDEEDPLAWMGEESGVTGLLDDEEDIEADPLAAGGDANEWVEAAEKPLSTGNLDPLAWLTDAGGELLEEGEEGAEVYDPLSALEADNADEIRSGGPTNPLAWLGDDYAVDGVEDDDDIQDEDDPLAWIANEDFAGPMEMQETGPLIDPSRVDDSTDALAGWMMAEDTGMLDEMLDMEDLASGDTAMLLGAHLDEDVEDDDSWLEVAETIGTDELDEDVPPDWLASAEFDESAEADDSLDWMAELDAEAPPMGEGETMQLGMDDEPADANWGDTVDLGSDDEPVAEGFGDTMQLDMDDDTPDWGDTVDLESDDEPIAEGFGDTVQLDMDDDTPDWGDTVELESEDGDELLESGDLSWMMEAGDESEDFTATLGMLAEDDMTEDSSPENFGDTVQLSGDDDTPDWGDTVELESEDGDELLESGDLSWMMDTGEQEPEAAVENFGDTIQLEPEPGDELLESGDLSWMMEAGDESEDFTATLGMLAEDDMTEDSSPDNFGDTVQLGDQPPAEWGDTVQLDSEDDDDLLQSGDLSWMMDTGEQDVEAPDENFGDTVQLESDPGDELLESGDLSWMMEAGEADDGDPFAEQFGDTMQLTPDEEVDPALDWMGTGDAESDGDEDDWLDTLSSDDATSADDMGLDEVEEPSFGWLASLNDEEESEPEVTPTDEDWPTDPDNLDLSQFASDDEFDVEADATAIVDGDAPDWLSEANSSLGETENEEGSDSMSDELFGTPDADDNSDDQPDWLSGLSDADEDDDFSFADSDADDLSDDEPDWLSGLSEADDESEDLPLGDEDFMGEPEGAASFTDLLAGEGDEPTGLTDALFDSDTDDSESMFEPMAADDFSFTESAADDLSDDEPDWLSGLSEADDQGEGLLLGDEDFMGEPEGAASFTDLLAGEGEESTGLTDALFDSDADDSESMFEPMAEDDFSFTESTPDDLSDDEPDWLSGLSEADDEGEDLSFGDEDFMGEPESAASFTDLLTSEGDEATGLTNALFDSEADDSEAEFSFTDSIADDGSATDDSDWLSGLGEDEADDSVVEPVAADGEGASWLDELATADDEPEAEFTPPDLDELFGADDDEAVSEADSWLDGAEADLEPGLMDDMEDDQPDWLPSMDDAISEDDEALFDDVSTELDLDNAEDVEESTAEAAGVPSNWLDSVGNFDTEVDEDEPVAEESNSWLEDTGAFEEERVDDYFTPDTVNDNPDWLESVAKEDDEAIAEPAAEADELFGDESSWLEESEDEAIAEPAAEVDELFGDESSWLEESDDDGMKQLLSQQPRSMSYSETRAAG